MSHWQPLCYPAPGIAYWSFLASRSCPAELSRVTDSDRHGIPVLLPITMPHLTTLASITASSGSGNFFFSFPSSTWLWSPFGNAMSFIWGATLAGKMDQMEPTSREKLERTPVQHAIDCWSCLRLESRQTLMLNHRRLREADRKTTAVYRNRTSVGGARGIRGVRAWASNSPATLTLSRRLLLPLRPLQRPYQHALQCGRDKVTSWPTCVPLGFW
jgi:hypothetical protein